MSSSQLSPEEKRKLRNQMSIAFAGNVPHNKALGIVIEALDENGALFRLPYNEKLVGNPHTKVMSGGAITALLDGCSGGAVFAVLPKLAPVATLDLRVDYLRPAMAGEQVFAWAQCFRMTRSVGFTRAVAYHSDRNDPIAVATATFMLSTKIGDIATHKKTADIARTAPAGNAGGGK